TVKVEGACNVAARGLTRLERFTGGGFPHGACQDCVEQLVLAAEMAVDALFVDARRRIGVAGLVAAAVTTGIVALAPTFPVLLASRALQGCAAAFFPPVALAYLTERITPAQRTMALTVTIS